MKQFLSVTLACVLMALCGCQYSMDIVDRGTETEGVEELLSDDMEVDYAMNDGTTIDSKTLVNTDDAIVRILGIHNTTETPEIELAFDKGNREYVDFVVDYVKVDGWQVSGGAAPPEGSFVLSFISWSRYYKEFSGVITIFTAPLVECGLLEQIHEIELGYQLVGPADEGILAEGVYSTTTSNEGDKINFSCDGPVLWESDGIKIQLYSFEDGTYLGEECENLIFYVENNSDRRIEIVIGDAEKYDGTEPDEEEEETEKNVIARNERNGKIVTPVPLYGDGNVCAGSRTLSELQTADAGSAVTLSDGEVLSFLLDVYDYEDYGADSETDPLYEDTVILTKEGILKSD